MKNLMLAAALQMIALMSCTTASAVQIEKPAAPKTSAPPTDPSNCVRSMNEFGHPVKCDCASGNNYSPFAGKCVRSGRMCTQALVELFNEKTSVCYTARNGCEASDLKAAGWRERKSTDRCR